VKRRKPATINRKLASLSAFCTWAQEAGISESDPTKGIQGVGEVEVGPRWLHRKAQYALLRELQKAQQLAASRAGGETDHPAVRKAARDAAVIAMEDYVATDERPLDKCLADVASCDIYIGIFAWRYGYVPPGQERSITELEYRQAGQSSLERLTFLLDEDAPWPRSKKEMTRCTTPQPLNP
jgi:hypothetical protein